MALAYEKIMIEGKKEDLKFVIQIKDYLIYHKKRVAYWTFKGDLEMASANLKICDAYKSLIKQFEDQHEPSRNKATVSIFGNNISETPVKRVEARIINRFITKPEQENLGNTSRKDDSYRGENFDGKNSICYAND